MGYDGPRNVETGEKVPRLGLEGARTVLPVGLGKLSGGRVTLADLALMRTTENEKWIAFYDVQNSRERARLNVLHQTGSLVSALR